MVLKWSFKVITGLVIVFGAHGPLCTFYLCYKRLYSSSCHIILSSNIVHTFPVFFSIILSMFLYIKLSLFFLPSVLFILFFLYYQYSPFFSFFYLFPTFPLLTFPKRLIFFLLKFFPLQGSVNRVKYIPLSLLLKDIYPWRMVDRKTMSSLKLIG